jgi:hypothetical protein
VADAEVALPSSVGGIVVGESLPDIERPSKGSQRACQVALLLQDFADLIVADA